MAETSEDLESLCINVIRGLAMDAPHRAKSGHQGTAMALAPLAHVLYTRVMRYSAKHPDWVNRDRFILSAGHASILQYALLYLTGYGLTLDDVKDFRQWDSSTPGHPEVGHTAGIEVTTGPLGQGIGNAVGMAISERWLRTKYGEEKINHSIFALCGDGDLSEGISHEAASFAGQQKLGKLVCIYDDNHITIDGPTELALADNPAKRFESYGWHVIDLGESAENLDALENALNEAKSNENQPSAIIIRSHIGFPSPSLVDSPSAHGYAFKDDEIAETKKIMGLPTDTAFFVPESVSDFYRDAGSRYETEARETNWSLSDEFGSWNLDEVSNQFESQVGESMATRVASGICLNAIASDFALVAGGADLTGNTGTSLNDPEVISDACGDGKQIYFGVREHAMGAIMNGIALHEGITPVGGTFLVFSDYMRPAIRLAALSGAKVIYSFTHDSVGVGEDGPTHQPVEHIMSLRTIPGLQVIRPADAKETVAAWKAALQYDGPTALILSRQGLPILDLTKPDELNNGAYPLKSSPNDICTLLATGSEVSACLKAVESIDQPIGVISMPSWEIFECLAIQSNESAQEKFTMYKDQIGQLTNGSPTISVEAGVTLGWGRYSDYQIGIDRFGASAPGETVKPASLEAPPPEPVKPQPSWLN